MLFRSNFYKEYQNYIKIFNTFNIYNIVEINKTINNNIILKKKLLYNFNIENNVGMIPLHIACNKHYMNIIEYLLHVKSNPNHKNRFGNTLIHELFNNIDSSTRSIKLGDIKSQNIDFDISVLKKIHQNVICNLNALMIIENIFHLIHLCLIFHFQI